MAKAVLIEINQIMFYRVETLIRSCQGSVRLGKLPDHEMFVSLELKAVWKRARCPSQ